MPGLINTKQSVIYNGASAISVPRNAIAGTPQFIFVNITLGAVDYFLQGLEIQLQKNSILNVGLYNQYSGGDSLPPIVINGDKYAAIGALGFTDDHEPGSNKFVPSNIQSESNGVVLEVRTKLTPIGISTDWWSSKASQHKLASADLEAQSKGFISADAAIAVTIAHEVSHFVVDETFGSAYSGHGEVFLDMEIGKPYRARSENNIFADDILKQQYDFARDAGLFTEGGDKIWVSGRISIFENQASVFSSDPRLIVQELLKKRGESRRKAREDTVAIERNGTGLITGLHYIATGLQTFDGGQIGLALGSVLGRRLTSNPFEQVIASGTLSTILGAVGEFIDTDVFNGTFTTTNFFNRKTPDNPDTGKPSVSIADNFGQTFLANIKGAGIGALSSYLTAELVRAVGLDSLEGEVANSLGSAAISTIISNIGQTYTVVENGVEVTLNVNPFANVGPAVVNAAASYLGSKLSSAIYTPETVGGQIGSAVGAAYGSFVGGQILLVAGVNPVTFAAAVMAVAFWQLIGGLIGSVFGGTPRSGADTAWDVESGRFVTANVYSRKGGSKEAARGLSGAVGDNLTAVLSVSGATLLDPTAVQAGNYGMRKKEFVYRPVSTRDRDAITACFSGKDGAQQLITHGSYLGLSSMIGQMAGGDVYVKRAIAANLANASGSPNSNAAGAAGQFQMTTLLGDVSVAGDYHSYLQNSVAINALIAADTQTGFAAGWLVTLVRANELGLNKRAYTDWVGGFGAFLDEAGDGKIDGSSLTASQFEAGIDDATGLRYWAVSDDETGEFLGFIEDTIEAGSQTTIIGTAAANTIDLRTGKLTDQRGYTVNGVLQDGIAASGSDFTAKVGTASFGANGRRSAGAIGISNDGVAEGAESFDVTLSDAPDLTIIGPPGTVTIVDAAALPTLMVGRSFAAEGDPFAMFRLSLSKATATPISLTLALAGDSATGNGIDFGSTGADAIQWSTDGGNWNSNNTAIFAANATTIYVRTPVGTDAAVEGSESFTLSATVTSGAEALANGAAPILGKGTIVDASLRDANRPLAWIDDLVTHEGLGTASLSLGRSVQMPTAASVTYSTSDWRQLEIDVAATVDAGDGNDRVDASDLGDNIMGGAGDDRLYGGRLDDWLLGGDGNDVLEAGAADQTKLGGDGNYLNGGAGDDIVRGREGSDWLEGGEGADTLTGGAGDDILAGGAGAGDSLKGGTGSDQYLVRRGDSADLAEEDATGAPTASGVGDAMTQRIANIEKWKTNPATAGAVRPDWVGTAAGVQGGLVSGGEDAISFAAGIEIGDIKLQRSGTSTTLGNDLIVIVMTTVDNVESDSGTRLTVKDWFTNPFKRIEWLKFADGNEMRIGDLTSFVVGGSGNDVLIGTTGNDFVYGGAGDDQLFLLEGDDVGNGATGNDMVWGGTGRDMLIGGLGSDHLMGDAGSDALSGDGGADDIYGAADRDILSGGRGDGDWVVGGAGDDSFKYSRGDGRDLYFDEYADYWDVVWTGAGGWNAGAGYAYSPETGEVTGPGGIVIRKNFGTAAAPDFQWVGRFSFDSTTNSYKRFAPPSNATTITANAGVDTIEFAPGINLQDVILRRPTGTNDLVLAVSSEDEELGDTSLAKDSVTIKDWFVSLGQIEKLAFYQTGILDIAAAKRTLIAGSDGADGTVNTPLAGTAIADWITGAAGDDVIAGGGGNDILAGNSGLDTLKGEGGDDIIYGGTGNDILDGGAGKDVLIGGAGQDGASYQSASAGIRAMLSASGTNTGDATGDEYHRIEDLIGGSGDDLLGGDTGQNMLAGGLGNDTLRGSVGDDTYVWNIGDGVDRIRDLSFVVEEAVTLAGSLNSGYSVKSWTDSGAIDPATGYHYWRLQIQGPDGALVYESSSYAYAQGVVPATPTPATYDQSGWLGGFGRSNGQQVTRIQYDYTVFSGNDVLELGSGITLNDLRFIRSNNDLIIQVKGSASSQLTLYDQFTVNNALETLQLNDGGAFNFKSILISADSGQLIGSSADDVLAGQWGGYADNLSGGDGNDVIVGYDGDDVLAGGAGDDVIEGGAGADSIDGGTNSPSDANTQFGDTVRYVGSGQGISIDLRQSGAQTGGDAQGDVLAGIEHIVGSSFADSLIGDAGANRLIGLDANDVLRGDEGDDVLLGGFGNDQLYGGSGADALSGDEGDDILQGETGADVLNGGEGDDTVYGGADDDTLSGGAGNDRLEGESGNDKLIGGAGSDVMRGHDGDDLLAGGDGDDFLDGGIQNDTYIFSSNSGTDVVVDLTGTNVISFDESVAFDQLWLTRNGNDLRIGVIGGNATITVTNFYTGTGASLIRSVQTTTHAYYLDNADSLGLVTAMTASMVGTPATMPANVTSLLKDYWHAGGKAAPTAPATARSITTYEDVPLAISGAWGVVDHDGGPLAYSIKADAAPTLGTISNLDAATGIFTYVPHANASGSDTFSIIATDGDGQSVELRVAMTVVPLNDAPGEIIVASGALSVVESGETSQTTTGTAVAQLSASDADGDPVTFSLLSDAGGRFQISPTGTITVKTPALLNYEVARSHVVKVKASDGQGGERQQNLTIAVVNLNEPNALPASYAMSIAENTAAGTVIGTVAATDIDQATATFGKQRYYFLKGSIAGAISADGRYSIDAVTGAIKVAGALNFEAGTPSATYAVIARDNAGGTGYNQAATNVTIGITDVNEANSLPASYSLSVSENVAIGTSVGSILAADPDGTSIAFGQQRYYFLNGSTASTTSFDGRYIVDAISGAIKTAADLNYEAGTPSVGYTMIARDNAGEPGFFETGSSVTIAIGNVNEPNALPASYAMSIAENTAAGTVIGTVAATDIDQATATFGKQRYYFLKGSIAGAISADGRYSIDAVTGAIKVAGALNFEAGTPSATYAVIARDNAGGTGYNQAATNVTIGITDVNEANSLPASYSLSVSENVAIGTSVGSILAADPDGTSIAFGQQRYYFLNGSTASTTSFDGRYIVDAISGAIKTAADLNYEAGTPSVGYTMIARDNAGEPGFFETGSSVTIAIGNVNEPNALPASYAMSIAENTAAGTVIGTVAATDIDQATATFGKQRYYFLKGSIAGAISADGRYSIDAVTGAIKVAGALNFEAGTPSATYAVIARDNAGGTGYNQAATNVTIGITDVNEANSLPASYSLSVSENVAIGTSVGSILAADPDGTSIAFGQQRYYFLNGSTASTTSFDGRYIVDAISGAIKTAADLNYEAGTPSVGYTMIARDNAGEPGFFETGSSVTIAIGNVNEPNALPTSYAMSIAENAAVGTVIGTVAATDVDQATVAFGQQRYYFLNGSTASATSSDGRYAIDAVTGAIKVAGALNFEAGTPSATYAVIARDNAGGTGYNQAATNVTIGITDVNEAPTAMVWSPSSIAVAERDRVAAGTILDAVDLSAFSVTDPDTAASPFATYTYATADSRFEFVGSGLRLKQGAVLDYEASTAVNVVVTATDTSSNPLTIQRTVAITVLNRDDVLEGDATANILTGQKNRDLIYGYAGNDTIDGGAGDDMLDGGAGSDRLNGGTGNNTLYGREGDDALTGNSGVDTLYGGANDAGTQDRLYGDAGDDFLYGEDGDDVLIGGLGADRLDGGAGSDWAEYTVWSEPQVGVNADLAGLVANTSAAVGDTFFSVENIWGSQFNDVLRGDANANMLRGNGGDDVLQGRAGNDDLGGGAGNDTLYGDDDADTLWGDDGNDVIYGGLGDDRLFGGAGDDQLYAESGDDFLDGGVGVDILNGGIDNDTYILTRTSGADTIVNYDPSGADVDVLGLQDSAGVINDQDLWFERSGNDMLVGIIATSSSARIQDWYVTPGTDGGNYKIDFIIANTRYSKTINVEGLVTLMATRIKPTTIAQRDALMADTTYKANWATFWGINAPPVIGAIGVQTTNEDTPHTFSISVTDDITPANGIQVTGEIISGNSVLSLDQLAFGAPDAAGNRSFTITPNANASGSAVIRIRATDAGGVTSYKDVSIIVNPVADTPAIASFVGGAGTSGSAQGVALSSNVWFSDQDGSEFQELWISGVPSGVSLSAGVYDSGSGLWKLSPAQALGLIVYAPEGWSQDLNLTLTARSTEGGQTATATATTTVTLNAPPASISLSAAIVENSANGVTVGTVIGSDPDGDTLIFSLLSDAGGRFTLSPTGVLTVANGALLDYEAAQSHGIIVRATDRFGAIKDQALTVAVSNVNEAPALPSGGGWKFFDETGLGWNPANGGVVVATFGMSDPDGTTPALELTSNPGGWFYIDGNALRFAGSNLDFEYFRNHGGYGISDSDGDGRVEAHIADVKVRATDGQLVSAETLVQVFIHDINEAPNAPSNGATYWSFFDETGFGANPANGGAVVASFGLSDPDGTQPYLTFANNPGNWFYIDGSTVRINGNLNFDFETLRSQGYTVNDWNGDGRQEAHVADVWVTASDGQLTSGGTLAQVFISNANEAPNAPSNGGWKFFDETGLGWNPANGGVVVATFGMSDPDGTTPALELTSNPGGWFYIDGNALRFAGSNLDFEYFRNHGYGISDSDGDGRVEAHVADVKVRATDGQLVSAETLVQVFIHDINEAPNAPSNGGRKFFDETGFGANPANGGAVVASFGLSDPDGTQPYLTFANNPGNWFYIDGSTVRINGNLNFDFETLRSQGYTISDSDGDGRVEAHIADVKVRATDGQLVSAETLVQVFIHDINEAPNAPSNGATYWSFFDETGFGANPANGGAVVASFGLSDPDGTQPYLTFANNPGNWFYIDGSTVRINGNLNFDFETLRSQGYTVNDWNGDGRQEAHVADVWVTASDGQLTSGGTLAQVFISNANEAPNAPSNGGWKFFDETGLGWNPANGGVVVATFGMSDPDGTTPALELTSNPGGWFYIDGNALRFAGSNLDFEYFRNHGYGISDSDGDGRVEAHVADVKVRATDGQLVSAETLVQVFIHDINEAPNAPSNGGRKFFDETGFGANPANGGAVVASFGLSDPDGTTPALELTSNPNGWFYIDGNSLRFAGSNLDFEYFRNHGGYGISDSDGDGRIDAHVADVRVRATDATSASPETLVQVFITDVNERPNPLILEANNVFQESISGLPPHSGNLQTRFGMSDPDGTIPSLVILGGNNYGWFRVNGNHIQISDGVNWSANWLRANKGQYGTDLDFNGDVNGNGLKEIRVATLTVAAQDSSGALSDPFTYNILIEDRNEAPIWVAQSPPPLNENPGWYQHVGWISGSDVDGPTNELRYVFSNWNRYYDSNLGAWVSRSSDDRFVLTENGEVRVNGWQNLDFDYGARNFSYSTLVYDKAFGANNAYTYGSLNINLQDVNEPHSLLNESGSISENVLVAPLVNGIDLRAKMLRDPDPNRAMNWSFADGSNVKGIWTIEGPTGKLYLTQGSVDYEALTTRYDQYQVPVRDYSLATQNLEVRAFDGLHSANGTFTASITDSNEGPTISTYAGNAGDNDGGAMIAKEPTVWWVTANRNNGPLVVITPTDPEGQSSTYYYSISTPNIHEVNQTSGGSSEADGSGPVLSVTASGATGTIRFDNPGDGEWEGAVVQNGVRRTTTIYYEFNLSVRDSSGVTSYHPFQIVFLRRNSSVPPIVLDLDGDGVELVAYDGSTVTFDMDGDGIVDRTGWAASDDGLLALDRNGNGIIDDISEISFISDAAGALSDGEGLRAFDSDGDGFLDSGDARFGEFQVWRDANQNGISEVAELGSLSDHNIAAINLTLNATGEEPTSGDNIVFAKLDLVHSDGSTGVAADVLFTFDPSKVPDDIAAPVVFDFDNDGAGLLALSGSTTLFDMNKDGVADRTGWIEQGDALLALDRNNNGSIDDIGEISFVSDMAGAKTDLEGLAAFDSNADAVLDGQDQRFVEFKLWFDGNANGHTDAGELLSLAEAGVKAIALQGVATGEKEVAGQNIIYNTGSYVLSDGQNGRLLDAGFAFKALTALPETDFQISNWEKGSKRYTIASTASTLHVTARDAKGLVDAGAGLVAPASIMTFDGGTVGMLSTILLDLDGDGLEARRMSKARAAFDMDGDAVADDTGWVGKNDGILVIDRDGDDRITDPSELSFLAEKTGAKNAWEGLSVLDSSRDGKISAADARFGELKVWSDSNSDGVTDAGELKSLSDLGIKEINLASTPVNGSAKVGFNVPLSTATFAWTNGVTGTIGNVAMAFDPNSGKEQVPARSADAQSIRRTNVIDEAAAQLLQAMSGFGAGMSNGDLQSVAADQQNSLDWFAASAA